MIIPIQALGDPEMVSSLVWLEAEQRAEEMVEMLRGVPVDGLSKEQETLRTVILIVLTELEVRKARKLKLVEQKGRPEPVLN